MKNNKKYKKKKKACNKRKIFKNFKEIRIKEYQEEIEEHDNDYYGNKDSEDKDFDSYASF